MSQDFVVIGAGIIGLATALELARRGAKVTVLERGVAGGESSWAGGGILCALPPWQYPPAVTRLTLWSEQLYPSWTGDLFATTGIDPEYHRSGLLMLPDFERETARVWCRKHLVECVPVQSGDICAHITLDVGALWLPQVAQVRNPRLIKALQRRLEMAGVKVIEHCEVSAWKIFRQQLVSVVTPRGEFSAAGYIVCGGAWSRHITGNFSLQLDIKPVRGQMLLLKAQPGFLTCIVLQGGIYLIPRKDGHILVGSTVEETGFDNSTTEEAKRELLSRATRLFPQLNEKLLVKQWAGLRPGSPHNIPTIDRHPQLEDLYINSGHFRYGVTMAPGSARILANLVLGIVEPIDTTAYRWPEKSRVMQAED
ncbi:MAG TPA: glycine oxidase ThiO [Burkholderiales bacterium]|nr:glycine oxidase ThiO [Burkholderiales bacterium]